jgi:hypothetical protein
MPSRRCCQQRPNIPHASHKANNKQKTRQVDDKQKLFLDLLPAGSRVNEKKRRQAKIAPLRAPKDTQALTTPRCAMQAIKTEPEIHEPRVSQEGLEWLLAGLLIVGGGKE